jgi:hypothetical protein
LPTSPGIIGAANSLTSTTGIVALVAAGVALVSLVVTVTLAFRLRAVRRAQSAVLGEETRDLVTHSAQLDAAFGDLRDYVEEALSRMEQRSQSMDHRIDGALAYRALVRYDAYGEMSGQQSSSFAMLDAQRSGIVFSSILHRDQARVYVKQVHEGQSSIELSPEEQEAIETALSGGTPAGS